MRNSNRELAFYRNELGDAKRKTVACVETMKVQAQRAVSIRGWIRYSLFVAVSLGALGGFRIARFVRSEDAADATERRTSFHHRAKGILESLGRFGLSPSSALVQGAVAYFATVLRDQEKVDRSPPRM